MIDVSKIRVGDEVTVRGSVSEIDKTSIPFRVLMDSGRTAWFCADEITTHTPKPREFKTGDRVTWGNGAYNAEFVALRGDNAAVWESRYGWKALKISDLRHADESE